MTFLGLSLFFQNTPVVGVNAAPSIPAATLNFDFTGPNTAPVGSNQSLTFEVTPPNAAPSIPAATLNFDFTGPNTAPVGSNQSLTFEVTAP